MALRLYMINFKGHAGMRVRLKIHTLVHSAQRQLLLWPKVISPDRRKKTREAEVSQQRDMKGSVGPTSNTPSSLFWQRIVGLFLSPFLCCWAYLGQLHLLNLEQLKRFEASKRCRVSAGD